MLTLGTLEADSLSTRPGRQRHCEYCPATASAVGQMPLMLTHDPVRHEQAESGASLFGGVMRLEEVVAMLVGNSERVVRVAERRPPIGRPAEAKLDMAAPGNGGDGVVDQIGR